MIIKKQIAEIPKVSNTPILAYCRKLVASGVDPTAELHVYRGDVLAMKVTNIGKGYRLTVDEKHGRPRFVPYKPFSSTACHPPMRLNERAATLPAGDNENAPAAATSGQ